MRPVRKGSAYLYSNGSPYIDASKGLIARIGCYCSYCERPISTGHEVEHIQPKSIHLALERQWSNFLLACKSCNATKSDKDPLLNDWIIPDRDNTFAAYLYLEDGVIEVNIPPGTAVAIAAEKTLDMMSLNKDIREVFDENGKLIAIDRRSKRMEIWALAKLYRERWETRQYDFFEEAIIDLALAHGFFSIWMEAFKDVPNIRRQLINRFQGTEEQCFHPVNTDPLTPHPNTDGLQFGGKL